MTTDEPTPTPRRPLTSPAAPTTAPAPTTEGTRPRGRRVRRAPILLVVVALLVAAVLAQRNAPADSTASTAAAALRASTGVPAADVASSAWYCAAGTSTADGDADETVIVASLATTTIDATVTVMPGGNEAPKSVTRRVEPGQQVEIPVSDVLATAEPGVVVETVGGPAAVSQQLVHGSDLAVEPCTRRASDRWYFAAGTTVEGSEHDLVLFNPFGDDAIADISFVTDTGGQEPAALQAVVVPRRSRLTLKVSDSVLRQERVATRVSVRSGRVVAEQVELFDGATVDNSTRTGIAAELGANAPAATWRVATGTTEDGGIGVLSLANFSDLDAKVDVQIVRVGARPLPATTVRVPSQGVVTVQVTARLPLDSAYALAVHSQAVDGRRVPVVAELSASWASTPSGVAGTLGTSVTASRWVVPQPDVDADQFLTVYNPGPDPVTAELLPASQVDRRTGATSEPELAIAPGQAKTVRLALLGSRPVPAVVTTNHPVVVGLTVLGNAGAAMSAAVPDLGYEATP